MLAKYRMTLAALGFAAELAADGIASNTLWPRTYVTTAAVLCQDPRAVTGQQLIDDGVLSEAGCRDLSGYQFAPDAELTPDLFLD